VQDELVANLYDAVQSLSQQVSELRDEQNILKVQVEKLHKFIFAPDV
jgi:chaperonin cofactor prefoldin